MNGWFPDRDITETTLRAGLASVLLKEREAGSGKRRNRFLSRRDGGATHRREWGR